MCFACDRWAKIEENIQAIRHTINALRGIARWGSGDMLEAAFTGFQALPSPTSTDRSWWDVLECRADSLLETVQLNYRRLARDHHPDNGGSTARMSEINAAWNEAKKARSA